MTKTEIARRLHEMVDERLFGNKPWPVEKESTEAVSTALGNSGAASPPTAYFWDLAADQTAFNDPFPRHSREPVCALD